MMGCRMKPSLFSVLMDRNIIKVWKEWLKYYTCNKLFTKKSEFKIQKYCMLKYKEDGTVLHLPTYTGTWIPFRIWIKIYTIEELKQVKKYAPVTSKKENDISKLLQFMDNE